MVIVIPVLKGSEGHHLGIQAVQGAELLGLAGAPGAGVPGGGVPGAVVSVPHSFFPGNIT